MNWRYTGITHTWYRFNDSYVPSANIAYLRVVIDGRPNKGCQWRICACLKQGEQLYEDGYASAESAHEAIRQMLTLTGGEDL